MREQIVVRLNGGIETEKQLFAAFTETMYLGESGISSWDAFYDLLFYRLDHSDIQVRVEIMDDFRLWPKVATKLKNIEQALTEECPDKLIFVWPNQ